ncbi:MAG: hypothetical protein KatS3mg012_1143 [Gaiellaceae bacterium]|nr:MAG: hypothetical protein KatS3mg012_1143 [Gaiellaceae bacterium]
MDALLAFAATLVSLRLAADLVGRYRRQPAPAFLAWAAALGAFALSAGALSWGAAAGWSEPVFRVYYLGGALLAAALLGAGSLLLVGRREVALVALVYSGLAIGVALAVPLGEVAGSDVPAAQTVLDLWPARALAIAGNVLGTLAVVAVAAVTIRRRPLGNALVLAGVGVAAVGSGLAGHGVGAMAPVLLAAVCLLYAGFIAPSRRP